MAPIQRYVVAVICMILVLAEALPAAGKPADASANSLSADSLPSYHFNSDQLIVPAALIAVGGFCASNGWFRKHIDRSVDHAMGSSHQWHSADYLEFVPLAAGIGLGYVGIPSGYRLADRVLLAATSFVVLEAITQPFKRIAGRSRPDMSDCHSFPSGHTATAFAGAELCRIAYGTAYGAGAYALATSVAAMRLAGRQHWLTDCMAGAGIGILSTRIAMWLLPWERRLFNLDKGSTTARHSEGRQFSIIPQVSADGAAIAAVAVF